MNKTVYSVGQVNKYLKDMFAQDFLLKHICIKGEVSNCKYHSSGHVYFTLKDKDGCIQAVMFAGNRRQGLTFPMKEGDKVIVTGSIEIYERSGSYQIYARQVELDGAGNLFLKFEELKRELEEMGMFDSMYKQPIPKYITRLGIVTAPTGAAVQDIRNIATRRNPYVQLILYPALVQGDGAAESIVRGIEALDALGVDVIIVGRGGGSIEDLWAFNEEIVARAIFSCKTPIISAVGHETDWTIADYVSDLRAPTPSAAAELAVFDVRAVREITRQYQTRIIQLLQRRIEMFKLRMQNYEVRLRAQNPASRLNENRKRVADYEFRMSALMESRLKDYRNRVAIYAQRLEGNSPMRKLSQGYALVEGRNRHVIKSVKDVAVDEKLQLHFADGVVTAQVTQIDGGQ